MKLLYTFIILFSFFRSGYGGSSAQQNSAEKRDTTITPSKDQISKDLIHLRDSIDLSISDVQKKIENKSSSKQKLHKVYKDLTLQRTEVEKIIDEVVITNERTWDPNIKIRALIQLTERRREYNKILNDVKNIPAVSYQ